MEIKITADWLLSFINAIPPIKDDEIWDIGLLVENEADLKWVGMALEKLNIPNDLAMLDDSGVINGFACKVIDFLKVQDDIPDFVEYLTDSGDFEKQFRDFNRAIQLKNITSRIKK